MNKLDVVKEVRKLLDNPKNWTKRAMARDSKGYPCGVYDEDACQWCLIGALGKVTQDFEDVKDDIKRNVGGWVVGFNDDPATKHSDILNLLDRMIKDYSDKGTSLGIRSCNYYKPHPHEIHK